MTPTHLAARIYAEQGTPVFPLHGKVPLKDSHGFYDATTDQAQIDAWWTAEPDANLGTPTGAMAGIVVIDIDPRHSGDTTLAALEAELGQLPLTKTVRTGGGGQHIYFVHPGGFVASADNGLGAGVDIKADGGYVVLPPSIHPETGRAYVVEDDEPPALLPDWVRQRITRADRPKRRLDIGAILDGVAKGDRDKRLFLAACALRGADVPYAFAEDLILGAAAACTPPFPAAQARAKVDSAYGRYEPRVHLLTEGRNETSAEPASGGAGHERANGEVRREDVDPDADAELPRIIVSDRFPRDISAESMAALGQANDRALRFFQRGNVLVRLAHEDGGQVATEPLTANALRGHLDRVADYIRIGSTGLAHPTSAPKATVDDILNLPANQWPLPPLREIARSPLVLPSGRELVREGYDKTSGVLVATGLEEEPPRMGLAEARDLLVNELFCDFPFAEDSSRAHAIGLLLQPMVRLFISGPTPVYLIDAPSRASGKGVLASTIASVALGHSPAILADARDDSELRKRITSLLLAGHELILLDNVYQLRSGVLAAAITSTWWADRLLGVSKIVRVRNKAVWVCTGNNVRLSDEITRRVVPVRLDPRVERPEERTGFKHPLPGWARDHRGELLGAALTLIRHWLDQGRPGPEAGRVLGGFESWVETIGGILEAAEIGGFLGNRERLYREADAMSDEWRTLCELWWDRYREAPQTAKGILAIAKEHDLLLDLRAGRSELSAMQRTGHALGDQVDRVFGSWTIRASGRDGETRNLAYRLEPRLSAK